MRLGKVLHGVVAAIGIAGASIYPRVSVNKDGPIEIKQTINDSDILGSIPLTLANFQDPEEAPPPEKFPESSEKSEVIPSNKNLPINTDNSGYNIRNVRRIVKTLIETKQYLTALNLIQKEFYEKGNTVFYLDGKLMKTHDIANGFVNEIKRANPTAFNSFYGENGIVSNTAKSKLNEAVKAGDLKALKTVWESYSQTPSGKESAFLVINHWMDTGETNKLYSHFTKELENSYLFNTGFSPVIEIHALSIFAMVGDVENFDKLAKEFTKNHKTVNLQNGDLSSELIVAKFREQINPDKEWLTYLKAYRNAEKNNDSFDENSYIIPAFKLKVAEERITSSAVSSDGKMIVTLAGGALHVYGVDDLNLKEITNLSIDDPGNYFPHPRPAPLISRDKKNIVTLTDKNCLSLVNLNEKGLFKADNIGLSDVNSLTEIPNNKGNSLFMVGVNGQIKLFEVKNNKFNELQTLKLEEGKPLSLMTLHSDGKTYFLTNENKSLYAIRYENNQLKVVSKFEQDSLRRVTPKLLPGSNNLVAVVSQNKLIIMKFEDDKFKIVTEAECRNNYIQDSIEISPNGQIIAVSSHSNSTLNVFRLNGEELIKIGDCKISNESNSYSYLPTILSDNKTILFPVSGGTMYIIKVGEAGITKTGEVPISNKLWDPTLITQIKTGPFEGAVIIGNVAHLHLNPKKWEYKPASFSLVKN